MPGVADRFGDGEIAVSAVVLRDPASRLLTLRKRGTSRFMLPGGKPEPGESPAEAAVRECREELGIQLKTGELRLLGQLACSCGQRVRTDGGGNRV